MSTQMSATPLQAAPPALRTVPTRQPLRYFGSKWRIAPWIISHLPVHGAFVEPYGGGAAVLLRKQPSPVEIYNDLDRGVVTFFKVLRDRPGELIRAIELTPFSRLEVLRALEARMRGDWEWELDELECARQFYLLSRQTQGGASRQHLSGWRLARTARRDNDSLREWNKTDHLWMAAARLKHVQIECDRALKVIERYDRADTLYVCDPPYVMSSRARDRRGMYKHDLADEEHRELAATLKSIRGMALVCGYPSPLYEELYGEWEYVTTKGINNAGKFTTECLWISPGAAEQAVQARMDL